MKRLIALTVAAVMSLTFFSPCLQAAEWDTSKPPVSVIRQIVPERPSGDADPWDIEKSAKRNLEPAVLEVWWPGFDISLLRMIVSKITTKAESVVDDAEANAGSCQAIHPGR